MIHGGQHEKTFEKTAQAVSGRMSTKGCWSVKVRQNVGVKVGCYLTASGDWTKATTKHYAQCQHGTRRDGGASRKTCLKVAKTSHLWCGHCRKAHEALNQREEEE